MTTAFQSDAFQTTVLAFQIDAVTGTIVVFSGISIRNHGGISYLTILDPDTSVIAPVTKSKGITEITYTVDGVILK